MSKRSSRKSNHTLMIPENIRIRSTAWCIMEYPKHNRSRVHSRGIDGKGCIIIGTQMKDPEFLLNMVFHEIMEAIFVSDESISFEHASQDLSKRMFVFNHEQFTNMIQIVLDGLVSCGIVRIPDRVKFEREITNQQIRIINQAFRPDEDNV